MIPVLLSGGSGTRLWPVSRAKYPKQFCSLFEDSLQNMTLKRLKKIGTPIVVTGIHLRDVTQKKLREIGEPDLQVIYEPSGKNTAPAVAVICRYLELNGKLDEIVGIFPADHLIGKPEIWENAVELAKKCVEQGKLVNLAVKPSYAETGYGYIQVDPKPFVHDKTHSAHTVLRFHEKPTVELAQKFLEEGNYFWNSGMLLFPVKRMIELFEKFQPQIWQGVQQLKKDLSNMKDIYNDMPNISIDYAILEKLSAQDLVCVPCDPKWSDVGSWDAVADVYTKTGRQKETPIEVDSKNNFVLPETGKSYAFVGVDDLIVVDTADALLVAKRGTTQDVKTVVDRLKAKKSKLADEHVFEERPWGKFEILMDTQDFKSKVIRVDGGAQISYQSHAKREEHWIITKGKGEVILNDEAIPVQVGTYVKIPQGAKHRIKNTSDQPLQFIEVQLGSYFGEDDIVRYKDDYKRIE